MTKYTVFYYGLNKEQTDAVNREGWAFSPTALAYAEAVCGGNITQAVAFGLYEKAAVVEFTEALDIEFVWANMQNLDHPWTVKEGITAITKFPRSMMVGDVVYDHANDRLSVVKSIGFETITDEAMVTAFKGLL